VKIKDNFVVWCHIYLPVSKWVTQQSYSASLTSIILICLSHFWIFKIKYLLSLLILQLFLMLYPSRWPRGTLYPQKLSLTLPTSGDRSVGIVLSRTQAKEFSFSFFCSIEGVRGNVDCYGNMLQAGRSRVLFPMRSLDFFERSYTFSLNMVVG
jgi:hypothetical protein